MSNVTEKRGIYVVFCLFILVLFSSFVYAGSPALDVVVTEYFSEIVAYDQTQGLESNPTEYFNELGENRTGNSRTGVSLYDLRVFGIINISNVETIGSEPLNSINITLNGTDLITFINISSSPNYAIYNISTGTNPSSSNNITIFIPQLRAGDSFVFDFNVSGSGLGEPLNFTENYTSWRLLTGESTHIMLRAENSFPTPVTISNIEVYKIPEAHAQDGGGYSYFNFTNITGPDSTNASIYVDGNSRSIINWNISNRTLSPGEVAMIEFDAMAPVNLSVQWNDTEDWSTWLRIGNVTASFAFNGSMSGLNILNITAIPSSSRFAVSKDRINETHWNATMNITNDAIVLDYNLTYVSVWATKLNNYTNPGDSTSWVNQTNVSAFGFGSVLGPYANATWFPSINVSNLSSNSDYNIVFNYSLVPIVWAKANFLLLDDGTQIFRLNRSETLENGYLFVEEIYVLLGGYFMKVTKRITPVELAGPINRYAINITVENVGTERSPEWVSMFDLVPVGFMPNILSGGISTNRNMTGPDNVVAVTDSSGVWNILGFSDMVRGYSDTGEISSGPYGGYWGYHIDFIGLNATSNGDGYYDSSEPTKEIGIYYFIQGNNTLSSIENAYIVGVDPIRLEGANPSKAVSSGLFADSDGFEYLIAIISLLMSVIFVLLSIKSDKIFKGKTKRSKK